MAYIAMKSKLLGVLPGREYNNEPHSCETPGNVVFNGYICVRFKVPTPYFLFSVVTCPVGYLNTS